MSGQRPFFMELMKLSEGNGKESENGCETKYSNCKDLSLEMVSESFTTKDVQSQELHFTLHIYKNYNLKLHKPLLLVKFALLFWYAGGLGLQAFFPALLKQRGLNPAHLSLATSASVVFQLLSASSSAIIADKIGRAKPILFAHLTTTVIVFIAFLLLPPLTSDSRIPHFQLSSSNNNTISRTIAEAWCNTSTTFNEHKHCKLYYSTNMSHNSNEDECFSITSVENKELSQSSFDANSTNLIENLKICYRESGIIMPSGTSHTFCNFTYCKILKRECEIAEIEKCSNRDTNTNLLFSIYALLIIIHYMTHSCVFRCYDVTVISVTAEHNADFGRQRMFSILGGLIGPSLVEYVVQATSGSDTNYSLAFVFYIVFTILSGLASWNINVRIREPGQRMWRKMLILLQKPDSLAFILVLLVLGASFNFMVIHLSWFLEDLGASKVLLELVVPLSNVFALISLYFSKWWLRVVGKHNLFIVALVSYGFFGVSYSFLFKPWYSVLIGAVVYTFSYHLFWVAMVEYAHSIAPEGLYATVIVMSGVLHYTVSKVPASLIGRMIMDAIGARLAFRLMGISNLVGAVLYGCLRCYRRTYQQ